MVLLICLNGFSKSTRKYVQWAITRGLVLSLIFLQFQCGGVRETYEHHPSHSKGALRVPVDETPAQIVAAELLSYMMQVVVGAAGDPANRQAWKTRSLSLSLDYNLMSDIMRDPARQVSELMVYDANILGLSKVLYHYNQRLNYFKGRAIQESVYPSEELLAIRLFIVQKIAKGEKVRMGNLMSQSSLLDAPLTEPSPVELAMINLDAEELKLLQDVIYAEPFFKDYLEDPFLVEALHRVGIVEMDEYVGNKIEAADYSHLAAEYPRETGQDTLLRVAILPSMTRSFDFQARGTPGFPLGFRANDEYTLAAEALKGKLRAALQQRVLSRLQGKGDVPLSREERERKAADMVNTHLQFLDLDKRPLVIYPDNAEKMIQSLCPDADFNFIILGKNVYLSIYIDEERDVFPSVNRMYLDIMDVGQTQSDYEIDQAGEYLFDRLKAFVPEPQ
jgi:hypothetical protein